VPYDGESDYRNDAGEFLRGTQFSRERFVPPEGCDHYHCECCNAKFMTGSEALAVDPDLQREGYTATIDSGHGPVVYWVCQECFDDLATRFSWTAS
jgi:hypothetical protein